MSAAPTRRPPFSAPRASLAVIVCFFLTAGLVPAIAIMTIGAAFGALNALMHAFVVYLAVVGAVVLIILFGLRGGAVWALHLLRAAGGLLLIVWLAATVAGGLLAAGVVEPGHREAALTGEFGLFGCAVAAPLLFVLLRGLRRVRWLDPSSTPDEWEPPARSAP